jgi:hypothetical protein
MAEEREGAHFHCIGQGKREMDRLGTGPLEMVCHQVLIDKLAQPRLALFVLYLPCFARIRLGSEQRMSDAVSIALGRETGVARYEKTAQRDL